MTSDIANLEANLATVSGRVAKMRRRRRQCDEEGQLAMLEEIEAELKGRLRRMKREVENGEGNDSSIQGPV